MREQRRRHLHDAHAAPQDAGGKAGKVAYHAAAKGNDAIAPLDTERQQRLGKFGENGKALARFAGRHDRLAEEKPMLLEAGLQRRKIERRHVLVAHHGTARAGERLGNAPTRRGDETLADDDGIAPARKRHLNNCLAQAGGQSGRAVAHHCTFLRLCSWCAFASWGALASQPSLAASASMTAPTITSWGTSRLSTVRSASS